MSVRPSRKADTEDEAWLKIRDSSYGTNHVVAFREDNDAHNVIVLRWDVLGIGIRKAKNATSASIANLAALTTREKNKDGVHVTYEPWELCIAVMATRPHVDGYWLARGLPPEGGGTLFRGFVNLKF